MLHRITRVNRICLAAAVLAGLARPVLAQTAVETPPVPATAPAPPVTFGVVSFLQYAAQLHEEDGMNSFDVTRGYFDVHARLSNRVRVRFTPDVRPTTDATLATNLSLRLEYAYLEADITPHSSIIFGMHETPWLTFEETVDRYRVQAPFFAERIGLIPGPSDIGASVKYSGERTDFHVGIYNGEGYGQAEQDKYKSIEGRATVRPFANNGPAANVRISGFYSYGWYAQDRPRNVAIVMGSYDQQHGAFTAQYVTATDNPFIARNVERRGLSFFGEVRGGPTGWAALARADYFDPDRSNLSDSQRRYTFGGAHWSQYDRGRLGVVISMEQLYSPSSQQLLDRRLLAQTSIEF